MLSTAKTQVTKMSMTLTQLAEKYSRSVEKYQSIQNDALREHAEEITREVQHIQVTMDRLKTNMEMLDKEFEASVKDRNPNQEELDGLDKYAGVYAEAYENAAYVRDNLEIELSRVTDTNYRPELAAPKKKYGDKKKSASDLLSRLRKEEAKSESIKDQRRLLDNVTAVVNQLLLLEKTTDNPLTRELIIRKFKYKIQKDAYGRKLDRAETPWTIRQLLTDLDNIITIEEELLRLLPKRAQDRNGKDKKNNACHEKPSSDNRVQEKKTKRCLICNRENHYMAECKTMSYPLDSTKSLEKEDRCGQCLRKGHK
ncbi:hypothetical protein CRE_30106 [Caenorhabditis remanei]|uniref:CCHC-type domain-containing protein n=1 Tax=Caenorhabditis remanei TaxID=31234 RepID=E3MYI1_CAERE|nr:hypothetical protein CRE_30106 [Caenorhabditis remanei]